MTRFRSRLSLAAAALFLGLVACKAKIVENGKAIKIDYTLTVDGNVVDTSVGKEPLVYVQGARQIVPGLEEQLTGLKIGDKKKVTVPPEKGYGQINPKAQQKIPVAKFGDTKKLKVGMVVTGVNGGRTVQAKVLEIGKKEITLDFNHPLAGKTLVFDITILGIDKAPDMPAAGAAAPVPVDASAEPKK